MTHSGYSAAAEPRPRAFDKSMSSTAGDFRNLTPLVLMTALQRAGTTVHEPMHRFRLEIPADTTRAVLPALARLRADPAGAGAGRGNLDLLEGEIPAAARARARATAARPDPRRGRAGVRVRALPARHRPDPGTRPDRPRPAQPARSTSCTCSAGFDAVDNSRTELVVGRHASRQALIRQHSCGRRGLMLAHLHEQVPTRGKPAQRPRRNPAQRGEPVRPTVQRHVRLVEPSLGRQQPDLVGGHVRHVREQYVDPPRN